MRKYIPKVFIGEWPGAESTYSTIKQRLNNKERVYTTTGTQILRAEIVDGKTQFFISNTGGLSENDNVHTFIEDMKHNQNVQGLRPATDNSSSNKDFSYKQVMEADAEMHAIPQISLFCPALKKYHDNFQRKMQAPSKPSAPKIVETPTHGQRM